MSIVESLKKHTKPETMGSDGMSPSVFVIFFTTFLLTPLLYGYFIPSWDMTIGAIFTVLVVLPSLMLVWAILVVSTALQESVLCVGPWEFVHRDGRVVGSFEEKVWFWRNDFERIYGRCAIKSCAAEQINIPMSLNPITDNPKVRQLHYVVGIETAGTPVRALELEKVLYKWRTAERFVFFHLFNFNEAMSRELGKLFNPIDEGQQEGFRTMLGSYLRPHLVGTGISFKSAGFSLAP